MPCGMLLISLESTASADSPTLVLLTSRTSFSRLLLERLLLLVAGALGQVGLEVRLEEVAEELARERLAVGSARRCVLPSSQVLRSQTWPSRTIA